MCSVTHWGALRPPPPRALRPACATALWGRTTVVGVWYEGDARVGKSARLVAGV